MSEFKVIDVSAWNGDVDFAAVKKDGVKAAILRITERYDKVDSCFEKNYKGFTNAGLKVGVYKYSYALTPSEIEAEAHAVVKALNGRKLDFPVFLDLEYDKQKNLGKKAITLFVEMFREIIEDAGYNFALYMNENWRKNYVEALPYDYWIASYAANDVGQMVERLRPANVIGWQFSQAYAIGGKKFDMSVFNKDYSQKGGKMYTRQDAINKVLAVAKAEDGYLEKASNADLDSKTGNAGYNNYTKYWRDIKPEYQGQPYCAGFVFWCFYKVFGRENAIKLLKHVFVYCPQMATLFTNYANPQVGDIVLFKRNGVFVHTGLVISTANASGDPFYTVEANTSKADAIVDNGGAVVWGKQYYNRNLPGTKFIRIDWDLAAQMLNEMESKVIVAEEAKPAAQTAPKTTTSKAKTLKKGDKGSAVKTMQKQLIKAGFDLGSAGADGDYGSKTYAAVKLLQTVSNITADGKYNDATKKALEFILKKAGKYKPWVAQVTADKLYVRSGAGTTYKTKAKYPYLNKNKKVFVYGEKKGTDGSTWYKVLIDGKQGGYCYFAYFKKVNK